MTFADLARTHRLLEALFARHQEAVVDRDWQAAGALLAAFRERLVAHAALEDGLLHLLERAEPVRGGTPEVYAGEHQRLVALLDRVAVVVAAGGGRAEAVAALDAGFRFKGLQEHHLDREEAKLFAILDAVATDAEREVLSAFAAEEERLRALVAGV